jgi:peptidoglycan/LPS O-acetylase OafA/YrhL
VGGGWWGAPIAFAAYLGRHSYSIYLWHMPAVKWGSILLIGALNPGEGSIAPYLARVLSMFIGSIALGLFAARLVEMPALKLRDRLFPSAARPLME